MATWFSKLHFQNKAKPFNLQLNQNILIVDLFTKKETTFMFLKQFNQLNGHRLINGLLVVKMENMLLKDLKMQTKF